MASLQDSDLAIPKDMETSPKDMETSLSKKMNRPPGGYGKLLIGVGLGVAIALIGSRFVGGSLTAGEEADPAGTVSQISAQTVTVAPVQRQLVAQRLTVTGTVEPADLLAVTPQISGLQIQRVLVDEGDAVAAGQPLVVLDDTDLRTQIQQAEAQIQVAEAQLQQQQANLAQARAQQTQAEVNRQRYQSLASQGAVSSEELDSRSTEAITARESVGVAEANVASATANIRSAQSDLEQLQTQLTRATVVAPADGIVAERPASVGDVSSTASEVVALIQGNQLELLAEVPQAQLSQVQVGAPVTVTSSTDSDVRVDGAVQEIQPLVDPETRTAQIVVRLPGSDRLRPGMFLTAEIQSGQRPGLTIPTTAMLPQPDGSVRVYVLGPDQTAMARTVEIGARIPGEEDGDRVEILQGLDRDEQIIVAGASYVQDGDVVTVAE